jgi:hypothetical protein
MLFSAPLRAFHLTSNVKCVTALNHAKLGLLAKSAGGHSFGDPGHPSVQCVGVDRIDYRERQWLIARATLTRSRRTRGPGSRPSWFLWLPVQPIHLIRVKKAQRMLSCHCSATMMQIHSQVRVYVGRFGRSIRTRYSFDTLSAIAATRSRGSC